MAWEKRTNRRWYYYRSRRIGGRVVKEYLGGPGVGEHAEDEDAERRARRAEERHEGDRVMEALDTSALPLTALEALTTAMAHAALEAAGFHRHHRGEWRRRRAHAQRKG